jgi:uncharacterized protein YukE
MGFNVTPEALRDVATAIDNMRDQVQQTMNQTLNGSVNPLIDGEFRTPGASEACRSQYQTFTTQTNEAVGAAENFSAWLRGYADQLEQLDQQMQSSISG